MRKPVLMTLALTAAALAVQLCFAGSALAKGCGKGGGASGTSGVDQYVEQVPTPCGPKPVTPRTISKERSERSSGGVPVAGGGSGGGGGTSGGGTSSGGTSSGGTSSGASGNTTVSKSVVAKIESQGGRNKQALKELVSDPSLGAPATKVVMNGDHADRAELKESPGALRAAGSAVSAAVDASNGRLLALVIAMGVITAAALGAAAYRQRGVRR